MHTHIWNVDIIIIAASSCSSADYVCSKLPDTQEPDSSRQEVGLNFKLTATQI